MTASGSLPAYLKFETSHQALQVISLYPPFLVSKVASLDKGLEWIWRGMSFLI